MDPTPKARTQNMIDLLKPLDAEDLKVVETILPIMTERANLRAALAEATAPKPKRRSPRKTKPVVEHVPDGYEKTEAGTLRRIKPEPPPVDDGSTAEANATDAAEADTKPEPPMHRTKLADVTREEVRDLVFGYLMCQKTAKTGEVADYVEEELGFKLDKKERKAIHGLMYHSDEVVSVTRGVFALKSETETEAK